MFSKKNSKNKIIIHANNGGDTHSQRQWITIVDENNKEYTFDVDLGGECRHDHHLYKKYKNPYIKISNPLISNQPIYIKCDGTDKSDVLQHELEQINRKKQILELDKKYNDFNLGINAKDFLGEDRKNKFIECIDNEIRQADQKMKELKDNKNITLKEDNKNSIIDEKEFIGVGNQNINMINDNIDNLPIEEKKQFVDQLNNSNEINTHSIE